MSQWVKNKIGGKKEMEKASKKIVEVEIEMKDGSKKNLLTLKEVDFPNLKLDPDNGLNLKRGTVSDDPNGFYVERRLMKRSNNAKVGMGDLPLPNTLTALHSLPASEQIDKYVKGKRIDFDADLLGGTGLDSEDKQFIVLRKKTQKGEKLNANEKKFMADYFKKLTG